MPTKKKKKKRWPPSPLICWAIFMFFFSTAGQKSTKFDKKQDLNFFYTKFVSFGPIGKSRWPSWPLIFETASTLSLQPLKGIQRNLIWSKIQTSSTKFVFLVPIKIQNGSPGLLCAETFSTSYFNRWAEINEILQETRYQLLLYQVWDRKTKMAALASNMLRHFRIVLFNHWTEINEIWQETKFQLLLY